MTANPHALSETAQAYENQSIERLFAILPARIKFLAEMHLDTLDEIVLDLMQPVAFKLGNGHMEYTAENPELAALHHLCGEFSEQERDFIMNRIKTVRKDGRVGIEGTLHRISVLTNRHGSPIGFTIRIGRIVPGVAEVLRPFIANASIMLIGPPGKGKSTILRGMTRIKAEYHNRKCVVVDTSGEIGGDGDKWHPYINPARRVQVPDPTRQREVLLRTLGNHTPSIIIIDEMGAHPGDVEAVETIARRGIQVIGTAHGESLFDVFENPDLGPLIGRPNRDTGRRLTRPLFQTAIEVVDRGQYLVHDNLMDSIDRMLAGTDPKPLKIGNWSEISAEDLLGDLS